MKTNLAMGLLILVIGVGSMACKPIAETKRKAVLRTFEKRIAVLDAAINLGMTYSNVTSILGSPRTIYERDGITEAHFIYQPDVPHDVITNGFLLALSNGVVIGKWNITSARN